MKFCLVVLCVMGILTQNVIAQSFNRSLQLEEAPDTTANISLGDFDEDGHLDMLLVKGRHWPRIDRVLLGDGFPDIAVSNDAPDRKLVYFNDGTGRNFKSISFGDSNGTVYGFAVGDFNEDGSK